jgi:predicted transcriptional regulator
MSATTTTDEAGEGRVSKFAYTCGFREFERMLAAYTKDERVVGRRVPTTAFTAGDLLRHAERFGTDCVYETGGALCLRESDRVLLKCELRRIAAVFRKKYGSKHPTGATPEPSRDDYGIAVDRLAEDNLADTEIAGRLGITVAKVRWHLRPWVAPRQPRRSSRREQLRRQVLALHRAGRMPKAIADELGVTDATVRRYLRELNGSAPQRSSGTGDLPDSETGSANPHG